MCHLMGQVILEETRGSLGQDVELALPVEDADTPLISEEELRRMKEVVRRLHERAGQQGIQRIGLSSTC